MNHSHRTKSLSSKEYYFGIYPLATSYTKTWYLALDFFYSSVPEKIVNALGGRPSDPSLTGYVPPQEGQPWIPIWFPSGSFAINRYNPNKWWQFSKLYPIAKDNKLLEVTHVPDDQSFFPVQGTWFYETRGSGVFLDLGKTLIADKKIDALNKLDMGPREMANLFQMGFYIINAGQPYVEFRTTAAQLYPNVSNPIEQLTQLFTDAIQVPKLSKLGVSSSTLYMIDRINNSFFFDMYLVQLARSAGYDTIQFTSQANGNGGWAWEIVFVNQPLFIPTDAERMSYVLDRLYIADPQNKKIRKHCHFDPRIPYHCIYCKKQTANMECRGYFAGIDRNGYTGVREMIQNHQNGQSDQVPTSKNHNNNDEMQKQNSAGYMDMMMSWLWAGRSNVSGNK